ncbi:MAG: TIGR02757 family protein [Bdellovibrionota bacterium]
MNASPANTLLQRPRQSRPDLAPFLEALLARYHRRDFLSSDPVQFVHRYSKPEDQEVAGLLSALFAFGNVKTIHASIETLLRPMGEHPARFAAAFDPRMDGETFGAFYHRWVSAEDLRLLLQAVGRLLGEEGSIDHFAEKSFRRHGDLAGVLDDLTTALKSRLPPEKAKSRGLVFLLASPASGSASKRLAMYARWMVRHDEIDVGLWKDFFPKSALRIPLDTHLSRIVRYIGLTKRKTVNWKMAEEVTEKLARIDPEDPVRFDFALARLGILRDCPHRRMAVKCDPCPIQPVCRLGREPRRSRATAVQ